LSLKGGVGARDVDILFRPELEPGALIRAELADNFSRGAHDHGPGGDF